MTEAILKAVFLVILVTPWVDYGTIVANTICILALMRQGGRPRFTKEYGRKLITNEFMHNIWYTVVFWFFPQSRNLIYFVPFALHFILGLAGFIEIRSQWLYSKMGNTINTLRANRKEILKMKHKLECHMLILLVVLACLRRVSIVQLFFYANFLRMKYPLNRNFQISIAEIDYWLATKTNHRYCPGAIRWIYLKFKWVCGFLVKF